MKVYFTPHRNYIQANSGIQKLFAQLTFSPEENEYALRNKLAISFVIDVSGSMNDDVIFQTGKRSKISIIKEGLRNLFSQNYFDSDDLVNVVIFSDMGTEVFPMRTFLSNQMNLIQAIDRLIATGGTRMDSGMQIAFDNLSRIGKDYTKKIFLFTDGETENENKCYETALNSKDSNISITCFGVGDSYHEGLLAQISDLTRGRPRHIQNMGDYETYIKEELNISKSEIITNVEAVFHVPQGVKIERVDKVLPTVTPIEFNSEGIILGNISSNTETVFIFELSLPERIPSKVRVGQVNVKYDRPGDSLYDRCEEYDLISEYTSNPNLVMNVNQDVMKYVQQRNIVKIMNDALALSKTNPDQATQLIDNAKQMTIRLGNSDMTQMLEQAQTELQTTGSISNNTRKTIMLEGKTKTISFNKNIGGLTEEEIRKRTGV